MTICEYGSGESDSRDRSGISWIRLQEDDSRTPIQRLCRNHKRVLDMMRQDNLLCLKKRFKPITTDSSHGLPVYPNLLKNTKITGQNQAWVSDIIYVQLLHEHIYLAVILDLYSRKCIGWELSRNIDHQLAMNALAKALENRWPEATQGLVHHSDQGVQYASKYYADCLKKHNILVSMSRKGNPYDNAFCRELYQNPKGRGGISE